MEASSWFIPYSQRERERACTLVSGAGKPSVDRRGGDEEKVIDKKKIGTLSPAPLCQDGGVPDPRRADRILWVNQSSAM